MVGSSFGMHRGMNLLRSFLEYNLWICSIIAIFGIFTNVIIIAVFSRLGYRNTINISMTCIAFWDLVRCACGLTHRVYGVIRVVNPADGRTWENFTRASVLYLYTFVVYLSSVLAGYVAVERCLCVSIPFTVKSVLTPRFTVVAMVTLSVVCLGSFVIVFGFYDYVYVFSDKYNQTIGIFTFSEFYYQNPKIVPYYNLIGILWPLVSFIVIVVCTVIIIIHLQRSSKFRSNAKASETKKEESAGLSQRDKQVVKMMLVVIIFYIINLFPRIVLFFAKIFVPEFYINKLYHNLFFIVVYFLFLFDYINSASNLIIFVSMSSNFRAAFLQMFGCATVEVIH
ncbi:uncharacterized protein LOC101850310 [Aplysia californica]|uniref:Uncharacterized protein LOC101850310 n=1 Tax=Aplysia californica TaxID=6500 RepID=A0ABM0JFS2_APLCA|nr:uncharacterized protein LOC101850310 [Aplysia californica]